MFVLKGKILAFAVVLLVVSLIKTTDAFSMKAAAPSKNIKTFHFGAGCFWAPADNIKNKKGIISTSVGYCGDDDVKDTPTYEQVCGGRTKLVEAVRVEYDAEELSFQDLLAMFSDVNTAQYGNKRQYDGIIFVSSKEEASDAEEFLQMNKSIVAKVEPMSNVFYTAEKYHQDYWAKWRIRIPLLVATLFLGGKFGGDMSQTIYNTICYAFIGFTLIERKIDTSVDKVIVNSD